MRCFNEAGRFLMTILGHGQDGLLKIAGSGGAYLALINTLDQLISGDIYTEDNATMHAYGALAFMGIAAARLAAETLDEQCPTSSPRCYSVIARFVRPLYRPVSFWTERCLPCCKASADREGDEGDLLDNNNGDNSPVYGTIPKPGDGTTGTSIV